MIRFSCPDCERVVEVSDDDAGLGMNCPTCGRRLRVPEPAPEPAESSQAARPRTTARDAPDRGMVAIQDCPACDKALQVPEDEVGRRVACPRCDRQFVARACRDHVEDDDRPRRRAVAVCDECGSDLDGDGACPECADRPGRRRPSARQLREAHSKKTAAGLCAIFLGGFGIHKFVLGFTTPGVIMLLVSLLTLCIAFKVMWIIGIIEGVTYLSKSDEDFYRLYIVERKEWF